MYTVWKKPISCLNFNDSENIITFAAILMSALSIATTAVPMSYKRRQSASIREMIVCTTCIIFPKLVLMGWTISVIQHYTLIVIIPYLILLFIQTGKFCFGFYKTETLEDDHNHGDLYIIELITLADKKIKSNLNDFLKPMKIVLGYNGDGQGLIPSSIVLSAFSIPLGLALSAIIADKEIFPSDAFPSITTCFMNNSAQISKFGYNPLYNDYSPTCPIKYTAMECNGEVKTNIIIVLLVMLAYMSIALFTITMVIQKELRKYSKRVIFYSISQQFRRPSGRTMR